MSTLKEIIIKGINSLGPMPVDRYMELCLTHPDYGYYMKRDPFGGSGDFTTAPEITQIFGEMIGIWCTNRWEREGKPKNCAIIELGPGRGTMMSDILRVIKNTGKFKPQVHLVEISPILEEAQRRKLQGFDVEWHRTLPQLNMPTIVIANEFFDALPIKQFVGDKERMIVVEGDNLAFNMPAEDGLTTEVCPSAVPLMNKISETAFAAAIIDYGYKESLKKDSLQALKRHKFISVLEDPGNCDLTAHVDFSALAAASKKATGLYTQGEFLLGHGADVRAKILNKEPDLARLIEPAQMGELFKVLCI